jgi:hypothetical protein
VPVNATHEWDGLTWAPGPANSVEPRNDHALAYDAAQRRTLLFGGQGIATAYLPDLGNGMGKLAARPGLPIGESVSLGRALVFDARHHATVYFGWDAYCFRSQPARPTSHAPSASTPTATA